MVVVTYNAADEIEETLDHLFGGTQRGLRAVVVDNASTDDTRRRVTSFDAPVEFVQLAEDLGYGSGVNVGAQRANREFLAVISQDVCVSDSWLTHSIKALDEDPDLAFVTPKILVKQDPERINTCGNNIHLSGLTTCRGYDQPSAAFSEREFVIGLSGAALVGRLSYFRKLGGFDESFFMYHEDTDLSLRTALAGLKCLYEPKAVVFHSWEPSFSPDKLYVLERNRYISLLKAFRFPTLFLLGPVLILVELAVWAYCLSRGPDVVASKIKAWWWLVTHLGEISSARRATQRLRVVRDRDLLAAMTDRLDLSELGSLLVRIGVWPLNLVCWVWCRFVRVIVLW